MSEQFKKVVGVTLRLVRALKATFAVNHNELAIRSDSTQQGPNEQRADGCAELFPVPKKLGFVYLLTPKVIAKKAYILRQFLSGKQKEHEALRTEIDALTVEFNKDNLQVAPRA